MKEDSSKITESVSKYENLEKMSLGELLKNINREDHLVPEAVGKILPAIELFVEQALTRMQTGGRLFYLGAGTSGRLGIVDASECPPTFGVPHGLVVGIIAGGDQAIRKAVEFAEDDMEQGWKDLLTHHVTEKDVLVGIAASGSTPYVLGALEEANKNGMLTAGITCNPSSPITKIAQHALVAIVGPEFVTGSTRMKSGTAQKLILNMISTSLMIGLGKVKGNRMVDMQLSNHKLVDRGIKMIMEELGMDRDEATKQLELHGNVRKVLNAFRGNQF